MLSFESPKAENYPARDINATRHQNLKMPGGTPPTHRLSLPKRPTYHSQNSTTTNLQLSCVQHTTHAALRKMKMHFGHRHSRRRVARHRLAVLLRTSSDAVTYRVPAINKNHDHQHSAVSQTTKQVAEWIAVGTSIVRSQRFQKRSSTIDKYLKQGNKPRRTQRLQHWLCRMVNNAHLLANAIIPTTIRTVYA